MHQLITIPFSHYCEKARWALDATGTRYVEKRFAPIVHFAGTLPRGGRTTPLLVTPEGQRLTDSSDILRYLDERSPGSLYPTDERARREVLELEEELDARVGPHTRRLAYHALLADGGARLVSPILREVSRGWQRRAAPLLARAVLPVIRRGLRIDEAGAARSRERLTATLDRIDARLADGRRYLVGERFTAADLTLAALLSPLIEPPEHPVMGRARVGLRAPTLDALVAEHRARASGQLVMRLYREERAPSMEAR